MRKPTPGPAITAAFLAAATVGGMLVATPTRAAPASVARRGREPRLSLASPVTGNLVAGQVQVAVAFDAGSAGRITLIELWVDDLLYTSQALDEADPRGTQTLDWDTQRLHNGQHSLKVRAFAGHKLVATDSALVTVSNGGVDVVPPLVTFYAPLDGQMVSGNVNIGVNATDNDQVALVGLFVNRQLRLMKSHPPFQYTLDTTTLPLLNGRGTLVLEAWAYDRAQNRGVAKPITVYVRNPINATPLQPDPKGGTGRRGDGATGGTGVQAVAPAPPPEAKPEPPKVPRLSPLAALVPSSPAPLPSAATKMPVPSSPPAPQAAPGPPAAVAPPTSAGHTGGAPGRVEVALAPRPSMEPKSSAPSTTRPSRSRGAIRPRAGHARLNVALGAAPPALPTIEGPRSVAPSHTASARAHRPSLKPAAVSLKPISVARVPDADLVAIPRSPQPAEMRPPALPVAKPKPPSVQKIAVAPARTLPEPVVVKVRTTPVTPPLSRPTVAKRSHGLQQGSTPDRIVLPVYRLARLPETASSSRLYTVKRGDTLRRIAKQQGVTPRSILVANGLLSASELAPGRRLSIPGTFTIAYNDQPVGFDVQPRVEGGMAIAPFRQLFEHTGGVVHYEAPAREVHALSPEKEVRIKIGSREALVNSAVVLMDRAAFLDSGRTMVPVKFMTEALDLKAEYDVKTGTIYLLRK